MSLLIVSKISYFSQPEFSFFFHVSAMPVASHSSENLSGFLGLESHTFNKTVSSIGLVTVHKTVCLHLCRTGSFTWTVDVLLIKCYL